MRGRKAIAGALSALMIATSVPTPALAEMLPTASAAETEPAIEAPAADASAAETPAVEEAAAEDGAANGTDSDMAAGTATEQDTVAEENSSATAGTETAEDIVEEGVTAGDAAPAAAANEPAQQAAGDPYEETAPTYDAAALARIYGSVSYRVGDGYASSTSVVSAGNFERIGKPMKNNETGGWRIVATLKADGTADDYGLRSWDVGGNDPASLFIDAEASDLSIIFETSSATDGTWSVSARAVLVFTAEQPQPAQPAQPGTTDVIKAAATIDYTLKNAEDGTYDGAVAIGSDSRMANITSVYWNEGLSAWAVDVTLRQLGTPADYGIDVPAFFAGDYALDTASSKFVTTLVYQDGAWARAAGATASLVFTEQVAQAPAFDLSQITSKVLSYDITGGGLKPKSYSMRGNEIPADMVESLSDPVQNEDGGWDIVVTLKNGTAADYDVPEGYLRGQAAEEMVIDPTAETVMQFTAKTDSPTDTTWTVYAGDKAEFTFVHESQIAPAFDINNELNVWGTVGYDLMYADGTSSTDNGTHLVSAENVASEGEPYQTEGGCWAIDVTLKDTATPDDYQVPNWQLGDGEFKLDKDASDLTMTFRTLTPDGTTWYCAGADRANLVFVEQGTDPVVAPAFDINNELNVWGTVGYDLMYADGTSSTDNGTHLVSAENVASEGEPYQTEGGCWAIDVTLKDTATPDDYQVPNWQLGDGEFKLDKDASDLTMTFRTLTPDGTTWYCAGADRANLVFVEQGTDPGEQPGGDEQKPGGDEGQQPGGDEHQPGDSEGQQSGDDVKDVADDGSADAQDARDNTADSDDGEEGETLPQTGDPLGGLIAIAAGSMITLVAGVELKRRHQKRDC